MSLIQHIKTVFSNTRGWFILCLCIISTGLSLSKPLMALGLFGLLIIWVADGNIIGKLNAFYQNKIALIVSSIYLITLVGLMHTSNFDFALDDLRRKLPLFFIPFFLSGFSPITKKELHFILKVFVVGVVISTFWSLFVYLGGLNITIIDVREYSRFHSHIRFGLTIALAVFFTFYFIKQTKLIKHKLFWLAISFWLIGALFLFSLFTGVVVFIVTTIIVLLVYSVTETALKFKTISIVVVCGILIAPFFLVKGIVNDFYASNNIIPIEEIATTKYGGYYQVDNYTEASVLKENGYFIEKHIAWEELPIAWKERSKLRFDGKDLKGQYLRNTLIRFITSKGLRKDKEGLDQLSKNEIKAIEKGVSNYKYLEMNTINVRLHKIIWEFNAYQNGQDFNGSSVVMRLVYWKTGLKIIKNNLLFGVGTGDVQDIFNKQYEQENSILTYENRLRTHNQYLTYGVSFGLVGVFWFMLALGYPLVNLKGYRSYLYLAFFSIVLVSMLTEDTLETQIGVNFFVFFNVILLLRARPTETRVKDF